MRVTVLDRAKQNALWGHGGGGLVIRTVTISDNCPQCGAKRGEPVLRRYCEDGEWYDVHNWNNPCGHIDRYADVLKEAEALLSEEVVCG